MFWTVTLRLVMREAEAPDAGAVVVTAVLLAAVVGLVLLAALVARLLCGARGHFPLGDPERLPNCETDADYSEIIPGEEPHLDQATSDRIRANILAVVGMAPQRYGVGDNNLGTVWWDMPRREGEEPQFEDLTDAQAAPILAAIQAEIATTPQERVSLNADGSLDEVWIRGVDFHLEQMDDGYWWAGIYRAGESLRLTLTADGPIEATCEDEGIGLAVLQEQETPDGWRVLPKS